jgi:acyl-CoA thioester hydrolase
MSERDVIETTLRVRYAETDAMGIVYHSNYIIWFEVGRGEYLRQKGADYAEFEAAGFYLPVIEVDARFLAPARYQDVVVVRTSVEEFRSRSITLYYEVVMEGTRQLLATGHSRHLCTDREGRVRRFPQAVKDMYVGGGKADARAT